MKNIDSFHVDISKINIVHEFVLNKHSKCEYPNGRKYYGVVYCIDGEAVYSFSSKKSQVVRKGDILLLSPDAAYSISVKNEFRHYTVNFEIHNEFSDIECFNGRFYMFTSENTEMYHHCFKKLVTQRNSPKIGSEMQTIACLYELLALILSEIYERKYNTNSYLRLHPARAYIEQHFKEKISLSLLANLTDMSICNFRREWLKLYNESAIQYRDKIRLRCSEEYLISGYYTVSEVASRCGFDDVNYFIRFFKKHTGMTPGKYKKLYG